MARTITEISNSIKADFVRNASIRQMYHLTNEYEAFSGTPTEFYNTHISTASIETVLITIIATLVAAIENMFEWHKSEIDNVISNERYGHAGWYKNRALEFQFGSDVGEDGAYSVVNEDQRVVKYAYVEENNISTGVVIKIAGTNNGNLCPLTPAQYNAFVSYINKIKPAGIPIAVINEQPDILALALKIYYNPLLMSGDGRLVDGGEKPVETAIKRYLNSIEFNGAFIKMKLIDEIQLARGVEVVDIEVATHRSSGNNSEDVDVLFVPYSGYMTCDFNSDLIINYVARL